MEQKQLFTDFGVRAGSSRIARNYEELSGKVVDCLVDYDVWDKSGLGRSDRIALTRVLGFPKEAHEQEICYKKYTLGKCVDHGNVLFAVGCGKKYCMTCCKRDNVRNFQVQLEQLKELYSALVKAKIVKDQFFARNWTLTVGIEARECLTYMFERGWRVHNDLNDLSVKWFAKVYGIDLKKYDLLVHSSTQDFSSGKMTFVDAKSGLTRAGIMLKRGFVWHVQSFALAVKQDKKSHKLSACDEVKRVLTKAELEKARQLWFRMVSEYIRSCSRFKNRKYLGEAFGRNGERFFEVEIGLNSELSMKAGVGLGNRLRYDSRSGSEELGKYIAYGSLLRAYRRLDGVEKSKAYNFLCYQLGLEEGRRASRSKWYGIFGSAVRKNFVFEYLGLEIKSQLEWKKAIAKAHPKLCPDCKGELEIEKESCFVRMKNGEEKEILRPRLFNNSTITKRIALGEVFRVVVKGGYDRLDMLNLRDMHQEYREDNREDEWLSFLACEDDGLG
ncbi:MAG: hypothetical protein ACYCQJ_09400 [Nitrososphaerales archaeon]